MIGRLLARRHLFDEKVMGTASLPSPPCCGVVGKRQKRTDHVRMSLIYKKRTPHQPGARKVVHHAIDTKKAVPKSTINPKIYPATLTVKQARVDTNQPATMELLRCPAPLTITHTCTDNRHPATLLNKYLSVHIGV